MIWSLNRKIAALFICGAGIILFPTRTLACSCGGTLPFNEVGKHAEVVILRGIVHPHSDDKSFWNFKRLEILEVMKGKETRETARIWGDNGGQCRPNINLLPNRTEWVIALKPVSPGEESKALIPQHIWESFAEAMEEKIDYALIGCEKANALQVIDEDVQGVISKREFDTTTSKFKIQKLSLEELRQIIISWD